MKGGREKKGARWKKQERSIDEEEEERGGRDYLADSDEKVDLGVGRGECHQR